MRGTVPLSQGSPHPDPRRRARRVDQSLYSLLRSALVPQSHTEIALVRGRVDLPSRDLSPESFTDSGTNTRRTVSQLKTAVPRDQAEPTFESLFE